MEYKYFIEEDITADDRYIYFNTNDHLCMGDHLIHRNGEIVKILGYDEWSGGTYVERGVMDTAISSMSRGESLLHVGGA